MTKEECKKLKRTLKKLGYVINDGYTSPDMWAVDMNFDIDEDDNNIISRYHYGILTIVDCSYNNLSHIKYRTRLFGPTETSFVYKRLEDCTVKEVLDNIKEVSLQTKKYKIEAEIEKAGSDFV